ncbi:hypothetical protein M0R45_008545 [Rubus argutus]|uniref:Uncharacterized protein n=1 Tax=Rubus argutus TaxID=59490 RepID=A0AAW1Y594_RUBAR
MIKQYPKSHTSLPVHRAPCSAFTHHHKSPAIIKPAHRGQTTPPLAIKEKKRAAATTGQNQRNEETHGRKLLKFQIRCFDPEPRPVRHRRAQAEPSHEPTNRTILQAVVDPRSGPFHDRTCSARSQNRRSSSRPRPPGSTISSPRQASTVDLFTNQRRRSLAAPSLPNR